MCNAPAGATRLAEVSLDVFRFMQTLEYRLEDRREDRRELTELSHRRRNPRKRLLFAPKALDLLHALAALSAAQRPRTALLVYLGAGGSPTSKSADEGGLRAKFVPLNRRGSSPAAENVLYPGDLLAFTRKPLFLIADSHHSDILLALQVSGSNNNCSAGGSVTLTQPLPQFGAVQARNYGEPCVFLGSGRLRAHGGPDPSPGDEAGRRGGAASLAGAGGGSLFTLFLASPALAFAHLLGLPDASARCAPTAATTTPQPFGRAASRD